MSIFFSNKVLNSHSYCLPSKMVYKELKLFTFPGLCTSSRSTLWLVEITWCENWHFCIGWKSVRYEGDNFLILVDYKSLKVKKKTRKIIKIAMNKIQTLLFQYNFLKATLCNIFWRFWCSLFFVQTVKIWYIMANISNKFVHLIP